MYHISEATEEDIPTIIDIAEKTWWPTYSKILSAEQIRFMLNTIYSHDLIREQIRNGSQTYIILYDDNRPQAFASYAVREEDPKIYKLHKIYVRPEAHGMGCGQTLVREIAERLRRKDIHTLDLNVNRSNPARSFYQNIGFRIVRQEDIPIGPFWMNDYVMRLDF